MQRLIKFTQDKKHLIIYREDLNSVIRFYVSNGFELEVCEDYPGQDSSYWFTEIVYKGIVIYSEGGCSCNFLGENLDIYRIPKRPLTYGHAFVLNILGEELEVHYCPFYENKNWDT